MLPAIVSYISSHPRTQIILVRDTLSDCVWLNLGKEYSKCILPFRNHRLLMAMAVEHLNTLIMENTEKHDEIGEYIALANTSILFEPELQIDIRNILEQWGKSQTVFFQLSPNAKVEEDKVFLSKYDTQLSFDLHGLNYLLVE